MGDLVGEMEFRGRDLSLSPIRNYKLSEKSQLSLKFFNSFFRCSGNLGVEKTPLFLVFATQRSPRMKSSEVATRLFIELACRAWGLWTLYGKTSHVALRLSLQNAFRARLPPKMEAKKWHSKLPWKVAIVFLFWSFFFWSFRTFLN